MPNVEDSENHKDVLEGRYGSCAQSIHVTRLPRNSVTLDTDIEIAVMAARPTALYKSTASHDRFFRRTPFYSGWHLLSKSTVQTGALPFAERFILGGLNSPF